MTPREKLQYAYELAFFPPRLHELWKRLKSGEAVSAETKELVDMALLLHQMLPEEGYASQRALNRLALYQAKSRAFGLPRFLRNLRQKLGPCSPMPSHVPGAMVRDIGLPPLARHSSPRIRSV